jgi:hypothetical protein
VDSKRVADDDEEGVERASTSAADGGAAAVDVLLEDPRPGPSRQVYQEPRQERQDTLAPAAGGGDSKMIMDVIENMFGESQTCFDLSLVDSSAFSAGLTRPESPSTDSPSMPPSPSMAAEAAVSATAAKVGPRKSRESAISTPSPIDVGEEMTPMKVEPSPMVTPGEEMVAASTSSAAAVAAGVASVGVSPASVDLSRLLEIAERLAAEKSSGSSGVGGGSTAATAAVAGGGGAISSAASSGIGRRTSAFKAVAPTAGVSGEALFLPPPPPALHPRQKKPPSPFTITIHECCRRQREEKSS